jgi:hypothetical protein
VARPASHDARAAKCFFCKRGDLPDFWCEQKTKPLSGVARAVFLGVGLGRRQCPRGEIIGSRDATINLARQAECWSFGLIKHAPYMAV